MLFLTSSIISLGQDKDGDGILDSLDLDSDNDGIPDVTESCLGTPFFIEDFGTGEKEELSVYNPEASTTYNYANPLDPVDDADYSLINETSNPFGTWDIISDHTENDVDGRMFIVNAGDENDEFYRRRIVVEENKSTKITFWVYNICTLDDDGIRCDLLPNISFELQNTSGEIIGSALNTGDVERTREWVSYQLTLNSENNSEIDIVLKNDAGAGNGNDFVIDDISVAQTTLSCDTDDDGIFDYLDLDSDNDGIVDAVEAGGSDSDQDGVIGAGAFIDSDNDGLADVVDLDAGGVELLIPNTDGLGKPNHLDIDSDNDGIPDNIEAQSTSGYVTPSGVGVNMVDVNNDGIDDNYSGGLTPVNTDSLIVADLPDYLDLDSDNDGASDQVESGFTVSLNDIDTDQDGFLDAYESDSINDGYVVNDSILDPASYYLDSNGDVFTTGDLDYRESFVPIAVDDFVNTYVNEEVKVLILVNDYIPNLNQIEVTIPLGGGPSSGVVSDTSSQITYTPNPDFIGLDTFNYVICDTVFNQCDTGTVIVSVYPKAINDTVPVEGGEEGLIIDPLTNDHTNQLKTVVSIPGDTSVLGVSVSVNQEGRISYSVPSNYMEGDSVMYVICDTSTSVMLCDTAYVILYPLIIIIEPIVSELSIPQGFSPNDDGVNDLLVIKGLFNYEKSRLEIINRWGNTVHASDNYLNDWDGTSDKGITLGSDKLPAGTYFYILKLEEFQGDEKVFTGYVYLNR